MQVAVYNGTDHDDVLKSRTSLGVLQAVKSVTTADVTISVYEIKPETGNGRSRVLHRNLLLPRSYLPVETQLKSSKGRRAVFRRTNRQQASQRKKTGTKDKDIPSLTSYQLQEVYGSTGYHAEDNCGIIPELVERDTGTGTEQDPCQDDGPGSQAGTHSSCGNLLQYHGCCNLSCSPEAVLCPLQYQFSRCIRCLLGVTSKL